MKKSTHVPWWAIALIALIMASFSSCSKSNGPEVSIATDPYGGIMVNLNWGGYGYYYPNYSNGYPSSANTFIGYIASKPGNDPTRITICNKNGVPICVASCMSGQWQQANQFFLFAQNANYPPFLAVKIFVQKNTMTNAPNEFFVVGY